MRVLAFATGYIDALGYLGFGRVFTANMSGNTVLLGMALAQLDGDAVARSSLALAGLLAGDALPAAAATAVLIVLSALALGVQSAAACV